MLGDCKGSSKLQNSNSINEVQRVYRQLGEKLIISHTVKTEKNKISVKKISVIIEKNKIAKFHAFTVCIQGRERCHRKGKGTALFTF